MSRYISIISKKNDLLPFFSNVLKKGEFLLEGDSKSQLTIVSRMHTGKAYLSDALDLANEPGYEDDIWYYFELIGMSEGHSLFAYVLGFSNVKLANDILKCIANSPVIIIDDDHGTILLGNQYIKKLAIDE